ncbi:hypothetical protein Back2_19470 [Nocardioides baekrokdamisoli]|uniref:Uncharacterized protein n=1 Tax=Nocardioides baekrokdamisoli TaxID=1804624 RepID=A0A3G9IF67_9ACTN|nr:hypothetical protein Back2_19470 [Nocardioides baekrokdamisoli]
MQIVDSGTPQRDPGEQLAKDDWEVPSAREGKQRAEDRDEADHRELRERHPRILSSHRQVWLKGR